MIERLDDIQEAFNRIDLGKIIAYPTEAVYGLGCDPFSVEAIEALLALKGRSYQKGLIVLISDWAQLDALIADLAPEYLEAVAKTWPGPTTWIFPKSQRISSCLSGDQGTIAIRMTAHPVARALSQRGPIVSTSANRHGEEPARSLAALEEAFPQGVDGVVLGGLGMERQPSAIYEVLTGRRLR